VEEQAAVAPDREDMADPRMEVECLRQVVQALGQLHQRREQEGLRTGQGSGEHNPRSWGHSTGLPRMEHRDIQGTVRRRGQPAVPVRLEAPRKEGRQGCQPVEGRAGSNGETRRGSANETKSGVSEA
jgi:hypothetical protein